MSLSATHLLIKDRLEAEWETTPIIFDNTGVRAHTEPEYISVKLTSAPGQQMSKSCQKESFLLAIYVNTAKDSGFYNNSSYCDTIAALFYNYSSGLMTCHNTWTERIGQIRNRYRQVVFINITFHQHY